MAECLTRVIKCLAFDIETGRNCHFALESAKSKSLLGFATDLKKWCSSDNSEYLKNRCSVCFRCRNAIGPIYGFWGPGFYGKWNSVYEPKEEGWLEKTMLIFKHGAILGL